MYEIVISGSSSARSLGKGHTIPASLSLFPSSLPYFLPSHLRLRISSHPWQHLCIWASLSPSLSFWHVIFVYGRPCSSPPAEWEHNFGTLIRRDIESAIIVKRTKGRSLSLHTVVLTYTHAPRCPSSCAFARGRCKYLHTAF